MPKKHTDDIVYLRNKGKYVAIGRMYDRDHMPYGNYFVSNKKYGRSMHWIGSAPDPDFIKLETAVEESRENIRVAVRKIVDDFIHDPVYYKYDYEMVDQIIQAIRKTFLDKKEEMLKTIAR